MMQETASTPTIAGAATSGTDLGMSTAQPSQATLRLWARMLDLLKTKNRSFADVAATSDRVGLLRAIGFTDPLDVAALETEWLRLTKMGGADATNSLARHFASAEARARDVWRATSEKISADIDGIRRQTLEEQRDTFLDLAKNGMLSAEDALLGTYIFWGTPDDLHVLRGLLLQNRGAARLRAHNFFVAQHREESFLATHGEQLMKLRYPLFPAAKGFAALNERVLHEASREGTGGSDGKRHEHMAKIFATPDGVGGGYAPIGQLSDGAWYTDVSALEKANGELRRQVKGLENKVQRLQDELRTGDSGPQHRGGRGGRGYRGGRGARGGDQVGDNSGLGKEPTPATASEGTEVKDALHTLTKRGFRAVQ